MGLAGMLGYRVRNALKEINPHLVTILMAGWEAQHLGDRTEAFDLTVQKPFQMSDITRLVNEGRTVWHQRTEAGPKRCRTIELVRGGSMSSSRSHWTTIQAGDRLEVSEILFRSGRQVDPAPRSTRPVSRIFGRH